MEEIVRKMSEKFEENTLILKLAEECSELTEILIKRVTKSPEIKPPLEKIIEEMGDVIFRMAIVTRKLGIENPVMDRAEQKAEQIEKWFNEKFEKTV